MPVDMTWSRALAMCHVNFDHMKIKFAREVDALLCDPTLASCSLFLWFRAVETMASRHFHMSASWEVFQ